MRSDRLMLASRLKARLSLANVLPLLALFLALGGSRPTQPAFCRSTASARHS